MPFGDRTGPYGQGPRTGRGLGYCGGYDSPGYTRGVPKGAGMGRGFGRGFGWRRAYFAPAPVTMTAEQEKQFLEQELKALRDEIKSIEKRLTELGAKQGGQTKKG